MSIFHYIKKTLKTEEIDLLVVLKYGKTNHTPEYLSSLPHTVIDAAYEEMCLNHTLRPPLYEQKVQTLSIYLSQPVNKPKAEKAIHESLVVYHSLLGTL